jgi:hypothetical protein
MNKANKEVPVDIKNDSSIEDAHAGNIKTRQNYFWF